MGRSRVIAGAKRAWRVSSKDFGFQRSITHLILGGITLTLYLLIGFLAPEGKQVGVLIIALGYLSLLLIGVTLVIGPINLLRSRRNPVNIDLRRDVGIWAAIAGCWHVLLVVRGTVLNGQLLYYFLQANGLGLQLNVYGLSNDSGLFATILLLLLLALSNAISLRVLKGKWWKRMQRLTYLLALLAVAHTFGYQYLNVRGELLFVMVMILTILVLACQAWGIGLTVFRQRWKGREHI